MNEVTRYAIGGDMVVLDRPNGGWVRYADHAAALAERDERIRQLEESYRTACAGRAAFMEERNEARAEVERLNKAYITDTAELERDIYAQAAALRVARARLAKLEEAAKERMSMQATRCADCDFGECSDCKWKAALEVKP